MNDDELIDEVVPHAAALVVAVQERDQATVSDVLTSLDRNQLYAIAVVLSASVDPDRPLLQPRAVDTINRIVDHAAATFGVDSRDVWSRSRRRNVIAARHLAWTACRASGLAYAEIGRIFSADHSTVMNGCRRTTADPRLGALADQLAGVLPGRRYP